MIISDRVILTQKNELVSVDESATLIKMLEKELGLSAIMGRPGIGLACPQIGISKKAAIVRINNNGSYNLSVNLINAKIKTGYDRFTFKNEGCLSFDGELKDTTRYNEIHVVDNAVAPHNFVATGLLAVAIQHELDHLDGILFFDRVVNSQRLFKKIKPNDMCDCGVLDYITKKPRKFKKCCGR